MKKGLAIIALVVLVGMNFKPAFAAVKIESSSMHYLRYFDFSSDYVTNNKKYYGTVHSNREARSSAGIRNSNGTWFDTGWTGVSGRALVQIEMPKNASHAHRQSVTR